MHGARLTCSRRAPDRHEIELYRIGPGESCIVSTSCLLGDAHYPTRGVALSDDAVQ